MKRLQRISTLFTSKLVRYGLVGLLGTFMHFSILIVLVDVLEMNVILSSTIGFIVTLIVSYFLNRYWTFRSDSGIWKQLVKYAVVSVTGLLLNTTIMYVCTYVLQVHYVVGQFCVVLIVPVTNYLLNNLWSFRQSEEAPVVHKGMTSSQ